MERQHFIPMNRIRSLALLLIALIAATALFWLVIHQIAGLWLDVALRPEVRQALERSLDDQKRLRALDDAHQDEYRQRFESTHTLLNRLEVIRINRAEMLQRFELTLVGLFALVAGAAVTALRSRARDRKVGRAPVCAPLTFITRMPFSG